MKATWISDPPVGPSSAEELARLLREVRAELEETRLARDAAEESLRETLAVITQHQQVGRCANFRYNETTGEITGTEEWFRIFDFPPGTRRCTSQEWTLKIHPDDRSRARQQFLDAYARAADLRTEYRIVVETGEKHVRCDGVPDPVSRGDLVYFGVVTDITEQRASEQAQRAMEAELAAALRLASLGELAGSIIHEINQPLAAIGASASACRRWLNAGPGRHDRALASLDRVVEEGQRAGAIISGLKSLIQNDSAEPVPFDFDGATREVCALIMSELARDNVLLETEFAADLPMAFGSRVQIQQVLMNLTRNAVEAMRASPARRVLSISTDYRDSQLSLCVADTGVGFDPDEAELLFKPLYTTKHGGMGLGLSISRKIAIAHGGRLHAEAKVGGGAVFQLLLPAEPDAHE